jgi:signal transduction histidine kinase
MNIKKVIIAVVIFLSVCTSLILYAFRDRSEAKLDIVVVNDIAQSLAVQWGKLTQSDLPCLKYGLNYVVLDNNDNFIAATDKGLNNNINSAISNRDTIVDIKLNSKVFGKLIIYNNTNKIWEQYRKYLFVFDLGIMLFASLFCLAYILYIDRSIFKPFRRLQGFARHVAAGNLDMPLEMDKGNMFGAFTESFDLMREELGIARENERIANQSKKELVASLSHDIKTPVASIKAVSEVMHAKSSDENVKAQLEVINSKADQINTLITNMFTLALEELQELKVTVTEQSSELLYGLIKNADYDNAVTISNISECIVVVDVHRLAQVVDNVISNSYKYAGTSIHVQGYIKGRYLEVAFKDYGPGVTEEERPLIFNKFYRAKNSTGKGGTGLGLYISKYLMDKMSGDITSENSGDGFVLRIKLLIA